MRISQLISLTRIAGAMIVLLTSCSVPPQAPDILLPSPTATQAQVGSTETLPEWHIDVLYPTRETPMEMGQLLSAIVRVTDGNGKAVPDANVSITVKDTTGKELGVLPAEFGEGEVYRTAAWTLPHRLKEGEWQLGVQVTGSSGQANSQSSFQVNNSTSEYLLTQYGFWLEAPTLKEITPTIVSERGDYQNGLIRWGGTRPATHIMPANWVELQWRSGDFKLDSAEDVRHFMLAELGDLGFTQVRAIGPFSETRFKQWDAWQVEAQGQYQQDELEWLIFYVPEVDKTYSIGTYVVLPPTNINAHAALRESFDVDPGIRASGKAPEPLPDLLPQPVLISPDLGEEFVGTSQPVTLKWEPVKELAEDEYYEILIEYDWFETKNSRYFTTRDTEFTLPVSLYDSPSCFVFNWQVYLKRQTGEDANGEPRGEPISYRSLYRYLWWKYPSGETIPFVGHCPNPQF